MVQGQVFLKGGDWHYSYLESQSTLKKMKILKMGFFN